MILSLEWQRWLYPLGFLATACFGARFLIQWVYSEWAGQSRTPHLFWQMSLAGNLVMLAHGCLQQQFPLSALQAVNSVCSWRQLRLLSGSRASVSPFKFLAAIGSVTGLFLIQNEGQWFRIPTLPWEEQGSLTIPWYGHVLGSLAMILFASRFWIQWWRAEKGHGPHLSLLFWKLSLTGGILSLGYYVPQRDLVNIIAYSFGLIPYTRNLVLAKRKI